MTPRPAIKSNPSGTGQPPWSRYEPSTEAPWNLRRVVHLHRRAGFAATWPEIQRDLKDGPEASIHRILTGTSRIGGVSDEFESTSTLLADSAVASGDLNRLKAWWVFRMLGSPDPLGERLTLMWHDHFATAQSKVEDLGLMRHQNDTLRRLARAPFGDLLHASIREPALLVYLDAPSNRKGHPNENLARELMELFTLGIGHYTELDVKEAARALTGWSVEDSAFREVPSRHDDGDLTLLGRQGKSTGDQLLSHLLDQPATAQRVAARILGMLMGEQALEQTAVTALSEQLRATRLDVGRSVETVLRSREFFDAPNLGSRVLGPVEFVVGACRALVPPGKSPSTLILADWITRLGQDLFEPPNVGGWPGGRGWLTPRTLVARANFASGLVEGRPLGLLEPLNARQVAADQGQTNVRDAASALLLGLAKSERSRPPETVESPEAARRTLASVLASPEAQLC